MDLKGNFVFVVMFEGDNFPTDIEVFSTEVEAINRAKAFAKERAYYKKDFKVIKDKDAVYRCTFDPEGGYCTVYKREMKGSK